MKEFNYSEIAEYYDILEDSEDIKALNQFLHGYFSKHNIKSVLDMTCGTGLQSIFLHKNGYEVTASDFNEKMLEIARKKYENLDFHKANMINVGFDRLFDAIISSFNAIGHLTTDNFRKTVQNARDNLKQGGVYIFDIFNFDFLKRNFISHEFIDVCKEIGENRIVRFNHNRLDLGKKIMHINQRTYVQEGLEEIQIFKHSWDMQIYSINDLEVLLGEMGFEPEFRDIEGGPFDLLKSLFILVVAKKVH